MAFRLALAALFAVERDACRGRNRNGCTEHAHKILLGLFAIRTQAVELQPVLFDLEPGLLSDMIKKDSQIVALKEGGFPAA